MKTKIIGNTYLRDIEKYELKMFFDDDDYIICVKKLVKCREKFIIKNDLVVMDDGYYVFEVLPKGEDYAMRLFLDNKRESFRILFRYM